MAHVSKIEIESSAPSFQKDNISARSAPKSSARSKKKHERKSEINFAKIPATQPF
ncbi:MAG: hypothetical protein ACK55Z_15500 [bacterium]|jgi:hypothetical protein